MEKQEAIVHQSLVRPTLLAGAERELVFMNGTCIAALLFGIGFHWLTLILSVTLATFGHWALVLLAKKDPQLRQVYVRHLAYQDYYEAGASALGCHPKVRESVRAGSL